MLFYIWQLLAWTAAAPTLEIDILGVRSSLLSGGWGGAL